MGSISEGNIQVNASGMDEVLDMLHKLPAMPVVVQEVISSFDDPGLDVATLARKISQDQIVAAKVLRVANSAFYGLSRQVGSIQEAVVILGFGSVRTLTIAAGLVNGFSPDNDELFDRKKFWQYSIRVAVCSKTMAKTLGQNQEIAFTAALLHDIGQMVLALCLPGPYGRVLDRQAQFGGELAEIEQAELKFDHATLGAEVAKRWNFPAMIQHAICYHHAPDQEPSEPITDIVHVADFLDSAFHAGKSEEEILRAFPEAARSRLGLEWSKIKECLPELELLSVGAGALLET